MPNAMPAGTPQVTPPQPTPQPMPQAAPEQMTPGQIVAEQVAITQVEEPAPTNSMVAEQETPKKGHGMLVGLILCLLLAAGGIGFGVWAWMDGNTQKDTLNSQIAELKKQNNELRDKLNSKPEVEEDVTVDVETDSNVNTTDYIYVGEWGYKIKIPEGLDMVSYALEQHNDGDYGLTTTLAVSGVRGYDGRLPDFANMNKNVDGLSTVIRVQIGTEIYPASAPVLIFSDDEYSYYCYNPQGRYSVGDEEIGLEDRTVQLIQNMLKDAGNWSKI